MGLFRRSGQNDDTTANAGAARVPTLAFCEPSWATPNSREHIRTVGAEGLKPGGGAPNTALCGRDLAHGWDLPTPVNPETVRRLATPREGDDRVFLCGDCATAYEQNFASAS